MVWKGAVAGLLLLLASVMAVRGAGLLCPPMNGWCTPLEAAVWVQTDGPAQLQLQFWPAGGDRAEARTTAPVATQGTRFHCVELVARGLSPGQAYDYAVLVDGRPANIEHPLTLRAAPLPGEDWEGELRVAMLAGHNPAEAAAQAAFGNVAAGEPDLVLWLGGNAGMGPEHWDSVGGYMAAYTAARQPAPLAPLLGRAQHLAVWGPSDYGPPGSGVLLWNAPVARAAFEMAWANPDAGGRMIGTADGPGATACFRIFHWGDATFYLLDAQSQRTAAAPGRPAVILGEAQLQRLEHVLGGSRSRLNCVLLGCPLISPDSGADGFAAAPEERQRLLDLLSRCGTPGLLVLSGQPSGPGELSLYSETGGPRIYELSVGPITAEPSGDSRNLNYLREPGTRVAGRHYALLTLSGPATQRSVRLSVHDADGQQVWTKRIRLEEKKL